MADDIAWQLIRLAARAEAAEAELRQLKARLEYYSIEQIESVEDMISVRPMMGEAMDMQFDRRAEQGFGKAATKVWTKQTHTPVPGEPLYGRAGKRHRYIVTFLKPEAE